MINPNKNYPGNSVKENRWKLSDLENEWRAQIQMALSRISGITHISSHMGCTSMSDSVKTMAIRLAAEYQLILETGDFGVKGFGYDGPHAIICRS